MPKNLITDIAGVCVGHAHDLDILTGVTAVLFDRPNVASVTVRGGAPGSRELAILEPDATGDGADAIALTGGSAFGLDAAGGIMSVLCDRGIGVAVGTARVPIVAQAITFDLLNGGADLPKRDPLYWRLGVNAADAARKSDFDLGSVGGGTGATTATFKGGIGSTSATSPSGFTVGALAVVNAVGSTTIGDGPHFWAAPYEVGAEFGGLGLPETLSARDRALRIKGGAPPSTTIAIVATDAVLTKSQAKRLALMADDGLARAVRPAHAPMDGDTVFAVGRQAKPMADPLANLTEIGSLAADCLARAIARAVFEAAIPAECYSGPPAYRDRFGGGSKDGNTKRL
ncbi:MAG: P1 family peptidase [Pseudomonadota bacterium]